MPLGSFPGSSYDEVSFDLASGDVFVFCSDGVFEAARRARTRSSARRVSSRSSRPCKTGTARHIVDAIFAAVQTFRGDTPPNDDMTAVAIRITS